MTRTRWTVLFLRGEAGALRQYSLPLRVVRPLLVGVGVLAAAFLVASAFLFYDSSARVRASLLARENQLLEQELQSLGAKVGNMETRMAGLAEQEGRARLLAGRVGIHPDVFEVGVGGPGLAHPGEGELWSLDPGASELAFGIRYGLDILERKANLLEESVDETESMFEDQWDRLEAMPFLFPVGGLVSSPFTHSRLHPILDTHLPHLAIDVSAERGDPIIASGKGVVTFAGEKKGYGWVVDIDHGYGFMSRYAHASKLLVYRGKRVRRNEVIALVGCSGTCVAPHLHFEIHLNGKPVDPMEYMLPEASPQVGR